MNIPSISFKGTYCIAARSITNKHIGQLRSKQEEYEMLFEPGTYIEEDKLYIHTPSKHDNKMTALLEKINLPFKKIDEEKSLDIEEIQSRIRLSDVDKLMGNILINANTGTLDSVMRNYPQMYVGKNGQNGSAYRYERFKKYLKTNQPIIATSIYLQHEKNGKISAHVNDGRHRFAVLRDMGLEKIPVAISKESVDLAKEIELF